MHSPVADEELLAKLAAGDRDSLAQLFDRQRPALRRMIELRVDPRLAGRVSPSDILQEAYIDAQERLPHFLSKPGFSIGVWLRLITGQCLIDVHRQHLGAQMRAAGREQSWEQAYAPAASSLCLAEQFAARIATPSQFAVQAELVRQLETALASLEPLDREVLTLRHFEELSNNEVAELLGLQKQAASKRYVRALARLQAALGE
ncbi:MAG: sigma-70 family RNA polymerase sigma factor [Pirellulales bacterium]|nr:sigma-70 family RNA polymerase sigma factor [Pirellulales bacterium]